MTEIQNRDFWDYKSRGFDTLKGVEAGIITPAQAVDDLKAFTSFITPVELIEK